VETRQCDRVKGHIHRPRMSALFLAGFEVS
jgi:hypothetical protein